jgi:hypothetical protein
MNCRTSIKVSWRLRTLLKVYCADKALVVGVTESGEADEDAAVGNVRLLTASDVDADGIIAVLVVVVVVVVKVEEVSDVGSVDATIEEEVGGKPSIGTGISANDGIA